MLRFLSLLFIHETIKDVGKKPAQRNIRLETAETFGFIVGFIGWFIGGFGIGILLAVLTALIAYILLGDTSGDKVTSSKIAYDASQRRIAAAKLTFAPDEQLAAYLRTLPIPERLRYLGIDNVGELAHSYHTCMTQEEMDEYNKKPSKLLKLKPKKVDDKYRYLEGWLKNNPNAAKVVSPVYDANTTKASESTVHEEPYRDENNISWNHKQDTKFYSVEESYDDFYMQREDEYREEYGDDYEDAIDDAWEERRRK